MGAREKGLGAGGGGVGGGLGAVEDDGSDVIQTGGGGGRCRALKEPVESGLDLERNRVSGRECDYEPLDPLCAFSRCFPSTHTPLCSRE